MSEAFEVTVQTLGDPVPAFSIGLLFFQRTETVRVRATKDALEVGTRRYRRSEIDSANLVAPPRWR